MQSTGVLFVLLLYSLVGPARSSEQSGSLRGSQKRGFQNQSDLEGNPNLEEALQQPGINQSDAGLNSGFQNQSDLEGNFTLGEALQKPGINQSDAGLARLAEFYASHHHRRRRRPHRGPSVVYVPVPVPSPPPASRHPSRGPPFRRTCKDGTQLTCPTRADCCAYDHPITCADGGIRYCVPSQQPGTPCNCKNNCPGVGCR